MRDSPSLDIIPALQAMGASIQAFDPEGHEARQMLTNVNFKDGPYEAIEGAHPVVIITEWDQFRALDLELGRELARVRDAHGGLAPLADLGGRNFYRGRGCDACRKAGYKGRMALYEIMVLDDDLRELVMQQASTAVLRAECRKRGMRTLRESGLLGIYEGQTTIDEVIRETMNDE
jgi:hypothetical protein